MKHKSTALVVSATLSCFSFGSKSNALAPLSIGIQASTSNSLNSGLSAQWKHSPLNSTFHLSGAISLDKKELLLKTDWQHFFYHDVLVENLEFDTYFGAGVRIKSAAESPINERYWINVPIGCQWQHVPSRAQVYMETAMFLDPLTFRSFNFEGSIGIRGSF